LIGTIMVGNVFRIIMPAQRALVKAIEENRTPDPVLPAKGLLRSRHNNYFTQPVLFFMISNHFQSTYCSEYNWLILAALGALSVLARHYCNTRHDSNRFAWALPAAAVGMVCLAFVLSPNRQPAPQNLAPTTPEQASISEQNSGTASHSAFNKVSSVIEERCTVCHSAQPTS